MENAPIDENTRQGLFALSSSDGVTRVPLVADPNTGRLLTDASGSSTPPGGLNTQLQFNNAGVFGGITGAVTDGTAVSLTAPHFLNPTINGAGAGLATLTYPNTATSVSIALPATTGTVALTSQLTSGTVTSVSVASANGFTGTVATATTTPAITLTTSVTGILQGNGTAISAASTTGSGSVVLATSPTLVTPALGVATATSINGNTFTTGTYTLTGTAGKTLNFTNTLTLAGTDSTTMTFPATSASVARTDAAQTFTGTQTFSQVIEAANAITATSNAATVPVTSAHNIVTNNSATTLTVTLTTSGAVNMQTCVVQILDSSAVAQTITWVNTENSNTNAPTTSNGSTTLPLTIGFMYNAATSKWRCLASA